jgi:orotate phosphoribosyltransferase-like protein
MIQSEIVLYIIKLVLGGIAAFLAVMLWSKTRDAAWISLVAGAVTSYAGIVFEMLVKIGIIVPGGIAIAGIPLATMMFTVIPELFFILAFILMIARNK